MEDAGVRDVAQTLIAARMLDIRELREGLSIASTFYVGRIALGNIQITVRPKISGAPLLHLLHYAYGLRDLHISTMVNYESEERAFQDILIYQLIAEVSELVARGLHRRYVRTDTVLPHGRAPLSGGWAYASLSQAEQASLPLDRRSLTRTTRFRRLPSPL